GELTALLALAELHLPREDRCRDGDDTHDRERADDREQRLDRAEETAARIAIAHSSPPCSRFARSRSSVARSSLARPARSEPAASMSFVSVSALAAMRAMCSSTTSGGALRMNQSRPRTSTAMSSSWPITGMKSGMMSSGNARYAASAPRTAFCDIGTRGSRASAHTRRAYAGSFLTVSTASFTLRGRWIPLATVDFPLREPCPQRAYGGRRHRVAVRSPERHEVMRLSVGHAPELDGRLWVGADPGKVGEGRADLVRGGRPLAVVDDEPERAATRREARHVHDRRVHEHAVRHDDLAVVRGPQHRRAERDLLDDAGLTGDLDRVPDAEGPLDQDPDAGEEVLEDVLQRQPHDDAEHAERGEDPAERVAVEDPEPPEGAHQDHDDLREVPEEDRDVRLG